jgi:hypothetical protein
MNSFPDHGACAALLFAPVAESDGKAEFTGGHPVACLLKIAVRTGIGLQQARATALWTRRLWSWWHRGTVTSPRFPPLLRHRPPAPRDERPQFALMRERLSQVQCRTRWQHSGQTQSGKQAACFSVTRISIQRGSASRTDRYHAPWRLALVSSIRNFDA